MGNRRALRSDRRTVAPQTLLLLLPLLLPPQLLLLLLLGLLQGPLMSSAMTSMGSTLQPPRMQTLQTQAMA
jgi:hypothetical protein